MKILIADDHDLFREGLRLVLEHLESDIEVIEAGNYPEALAAAEREEGMSLVLQDLAMPGMSWSDGLIAMRERCGDTPIVILSASEDRDLVKQAVQQGAAGFIPKSANSKVMLSALRLVLSGGVYLPAALLDQNAPPPLERPEASHASVATKAAADLLTPRQREVLTLLGEGKSNKEIARILDLSEGTVKLHVTAILKALKVNNRTRAVVAASQMGLTSADED